MNVRESVETLSDQGIMKARYLPEKSILVTCIGATIGKVGLIRKAGASNQQINAILPYRYIHPEFIYYQITNPIFQKKIKEHASATTLPIINKTKFENLNIFIPPLAEQQRIVSKIEELFSELDQGIENLKTAQKQLKIYRQSVLKSAFEGKLTEEWRKEHPNQVASNDLTEERDSSLWGLPSGWKKVKFNDFCKLQRGYDLPLKKILPGHYPVVTSSGVNGYHSEFRANGPCLITGRSGGVGNIHFLKVEKYWPHNTSLFVKDFCANYPEFVYYFFLKFNFKSFSASIAIPTLDRKQLYNEIVYLPKLSEQRAIVQEIESRFSICDKLEETIQSSLKQAESLRQSILKKAFEGKLVAQNPNDEPASVLLERIRAEKNTTFEKTNVNSARKVAENALSPKDNLIQFPRLIPEISTTDLHAGVIAMVIEAHEKQPKYLEYLGHVKCEKIAHLVESHLGISLGRTPVKDTAGPDDYPHLKKVESRAIKANYFGIKKLNIGHTYQSKHGMQKILTQASNCLDSKDLQKIRNLIQLTLKMNKEQAEIFATLYAGWSNLLLEGRQPSDEEIVYESRENWSPEKLKLSRYRFFTALLWMRRKGYIPEGKGAIVPKSGKKTSTQKRKKGIA